MKHTLSGQDAAYVNTAVGFSRDPGENPEDNPGAVEGDSYDALELPNGNRLIILGVRDGNVVGVEVPANEVDEVETVTDESPVNPGA